MSVTMRVFGIPGPQGSKRSVGRGIMIEASAKVKPWREAIVGQALRQGFHTLNLDYPVAVRVDFMFPRPKAHYGRRQGQPYLKDNAPLYKAGTPDLDKLQRATGDGLVQAGVLKDDDLIVVWHARKIYTEQPAGALIEILPA